MRLVAVIGADDQKRSIKTSYIKVILTSDMI